MLIGGLMWPVSTSFRPSSASAFAVLAVLAVLAELGQHVIKPCQVQGWVSGTTCAAAPRELHGRPTSAWVWASSAGGEPCLCTVLVSPRPGASCMGYIYNSSSNSACMASVVWKLVGQSVCHMHAELTGPSTTRAEVSEGANFAKLDGADN